MIDLRKISFVLAAAVCIGSLYGCAGSSPQVPTPDAKEFSIEETTEAEEETETEEATEPDTEAVKEDIPPAEGMVRSPITNEWVTAERAAERPLAVMYPTDKAAQPQYGLDRAEVFYEIMEEGSISRQMAIMTDWHDLERIGNLRSIRDYFIYEALEWDAIIVHFGGPEVFVKEMLTRKDVDNINGVDGVLGPSYGAFYRVPKGTNNVHKAFTDGNHIDAAIEKAGFDREHRTEYYDTERWRFARESEPVELSERSDAVSAVNFDMTGCYPITKTQLAYNEEDGLYYRSIYGKPQCDAVTGTQLSFKNVLIESCTSGSRGGGYLYMHVLDEGHEGYYATGGKMIHVTWGKTADYETTRFYNDDGEEIMLNTGRTMVFIARTGQDSFKADGAEYHL
ncbi:MAG: DUF3048 domain-containing protein [Eubacteriales bacterium]|nr:DUF3048 domain-containing protein [Eubacteriales bacterium]